MKFTVIGIYDDNGQRFAFHVEAPTPLEAEHKAANDAEGSITVAGVAEGHIELVDQDPVLGPVGQDEP